MDRLRIKFVKSNDINSPFLLTRSYRRMIVGGLTLKSSINLTYSLSNSRCCAESLNYLSLYNVDCQGDSLIRLISGLKCLEYLTLNKVRCSDDTKSSRTSCSFDLPALKRIVLLNCEYASLINILLWSKIQTRDIEFSYNGKLKYPKFIGQQNCLENLIITRLRHNQIEDLMKQLIDSKVYRNDLRKIAILDKPNTEYDCTSDRQNVNLSAYLSTYVCHLRELHLEYFVNLEILSVIANYMKLETLSFRKLEDLSDELCTIKREMKSAELNKNMHLKTLWMGSAYGLNELSSIFPSIETLKAKFTAKFQKSQENMDCIGNFKSLKNLCMEYPSTFVSSIPPILPSLKLVSLKLTDLFRLKKFLEINASSIDCLLVTNFYLPSSKKKKKLTQDEVLEFLSKFRRIVFIDPYENHQTFCPNLRDLQSLLNGPEDIEKYTDKIIIEMGSVKFQEALKHFGRDTVIMKLLRCISSKTHCEYINLFEMNIGYIRDGDDRMSNDEADYCIVYDEEEWNSDNCCYSSD